MTSRRSPDIFDEYVALLTNYGAVQKRCTRLFANQAAEIERVQAEAMRLRAAVIMRDTALAALRGELAALHAAVPGLPKRRTTIVERLLLTVAAKMRTVAQRWKRIRMLRI